MDPLTQIYLDNNLPYIVEGTVEENARKWREALAEENGVVSFISHHPQEMFPPVPLYLRADCIASMVEESAEAWSFQQHIESEQYKKWAEEQDE